MFRPRYIYLAFFVLLIGNLGMAQPFNLDDDIQPVKLILHPVDDESNPDLKGQMSISDIRQVKDTMYFFVNGLSIYSPTYVSTEVHEGYESLDVSLHKMNWKKAERSGKTNADGEWFESFKTEMDFGIRVIAKEKPTNYTLMVWSGAEANFDLPEIFGHEEDSSSGILSWLKTNWIYALVIFLVLIILLLIVKRKK